MTGIVGGVKVVSERWGCSKQDGDEGVLHLRQIKSSGLGKKGAWVRGRRKRQTVAWWL